MFDLPPSSSSSFFFFSFKFVVNHIVVDLLLFFPWRQELGQWDIYAKGYGKNTKTVQHISIA